MRGRSSPARIGALAALPLALSFAQLARGAPRTPRVGGLASRRDRGRRVAHRVTRAARLTRSRPGAARRVAGERGGHADRRSAHDARRARARTGHRHRPRLRGARRARARRRPVRRRAARGTTRLRPRQRRARHARAGRPRRGRRPMRRDRTSPNRRWTGCRNERRRRRHRGRTGCSLAPGHWSPPATRPTTLFRSALDELSRHHDRHRDGTDAAAARRVVAAGTASQGSPRTAARGARLLREHRRRPASPRVRRAELAATGEQRAKPVGAGRRPHAPGSADRPPRGLR